LNFLWLITIMNIFRKRIRGDIFAPVRFFTPFPHRLLGICGSAPVYLSPAFKSSTVKKMPHILFRSCSYSPRCPTSSDSLGGNEGRLG
jgi:hypothetical protein